MQFHYAICKLTFTCPLNYQGSPSEQQRYKRDPGCQHELEESIVAAFGLVIQWFE